MAMFQKKMCVMLFLHYIRADITGLKHNMTVFSNRKYDLHMFCYVTKSYTK